MEAFDVIAKSYDTVFTNSEVGKLQRKIVWAFLEKQNLRGKDILEVNCGTGEDALFLAQGGSLVSACDISEGMLAIAKEKIKQHNLNINTFSWNMNQPFPAPDNKYDLIFSNFGGLNCLSPDTLSKLSGTFNNLLNPGGKLIFVLMGRFCFMETAYFLFKGKFKNAFRRKGKKPVKAMLDKKVCIDTWYYSAKEIHTIFFDNFQPRKKIPVGIFVPPSYLDAIFRRKKTVLNFLARMDSMLAHVNLLSSWSDHYLIELEKK